MNISLVLCTKNRGAQLPKCLAALDRMHRADELQLLLVDNGSTDGITFELLTEYSKRTRFSCQVLQTFEAGNSAGRNVALPHVTGDYVLFIDDDCYVDSDFVVEWKRVLQQHQLGYGTGMIKRYDLAFSSIGCVETTQVELISPGSYVRRGFMQGSNMMFSRQCLEAIGAFDRRFGAGADYAGEDWDAGLRASYAGWAGGYFPGPKVSHDHQRTEADAAVRRVFYDYGAGAVFAKNIPRRGGYRVFRHFVREVRWQTDHQRRAAFVKGFVGFMIKSAGRKP